MSYLREPLEVTFSDKGPPTEPGSTIIAGSSEGKSSLSINPRAHARVLGFHLCCGRIGKFTCCIPCQPIVKTIFPAHEWVLLRFIEFIAGRGYMSAVCLVTQLGYQLKISQCATY